MTVRQGTLRRWTLVRYCRSYQSTPRHQYHVRFSSEWKMRSQLYKGPLMLVDSSRHGDNSLLCSGWHKQNAVRRFLLCLLPTLTPKVDQYDSNDPRQRDPLTIETRCKFWWRIQGLGASLSFILGRALTIPQNQGFPLPRFDVPQRSLHSLARSNSLLIQHMSESLASSKIEHYKISGIFADPRELKSCQSTRFQEPASTENDHALIKADLHIRRHFYIMVIRCHRAQVLLNGLLDLDGSSQTESFSASSRLNRPKKTENTIEENANLSETYKREKILSCARSILDAFQFIHLSVRDRLRFQWLQCLAGFCSAAILGVSCLAEDMPARNDCDLIQKVQTIFEQLRTDEPANTLIEHANKKLSELLVCLDGTIRDPHDTKDIPTYPVDEPVTHNFQKTARVRRSSQDHTEHDISAVSSPPKKRKLSPTRIEKPQPGTHWSQPPNRLPERTLMNYQTHAQQPWPQPAAAFPQDPMYATNAASASNGVHHQQDTQMYTVSNDLSAVSSFAENTQDMAPPHPPQVLAYSQLSHAHVHPPEEWKPPLEYPVWEARYQLGYDNRPYWADDGMQYSADFAVASQHQPHSHVGHALPGTSTANQISGMQIQLTNHTGLMPTAEQNSQGIKRRMSGQVGNSSLSAPAERRRSINNTTTQLPNARTPHKQSQQQNDRTRYGNAVAHLKAGQPSPASTGSITPTQSPMDAQPHHFTQVPTQHLYQSQPHAQATQSNTFIQPQTSYIDATEHGMPAWTGPLNPMIYYDQYDGSGGASFGMDMTAPQMHYDGAMRSFEMQNQHFAPPMQAVGGSMGDGYNMHWSR